MISAASYLHRVTGSAFRISPRSRSTKLAAIVASDKELAAELATYRDFSGVQRLVTTELRDQARALIARIEKSK